MRRHRETEEVLQVEVIVKFLKSFRLRRYGSVDGTQDQRMPKHVARATTEGTRKVEDRLKQGEMTFRRT